MCINARFRLPKNGKPLDIARISPFARERHHVPNTFKAQRDHFQGLREPFSQPKFHPLHKSGKRTSVRKSEGQENGYGRYCNHNMRRALPRTPPDVAGLLSARYLTTPPHEARGSCAGTENCQARSPSSLTRQRPLKNKLATKQGYPDVSAVAGGLITPAGDIRRTLISFRPCLCATAREHAISWRSDKRDSQPALRSSMGRMFSGCAISITRQQQRQPPAEGTLDRTQNGKIVYSL